MFFYFLVRVVNAFKSMIFNESLDSLIINQLFLCFFFVANLCHIERTINHFKSKSKGVATENILEIKAINFDHKNQIFFLKI